MGTEKSEAGQIPARRPLLSRADVIAAGAVMALAMILRLAYLNDWVVSPYFGNPLYDEEYIHNWAAEMAGGHFRAEPFFRPPAYPCLLAGIYRIWGLGPIMPRLFQLCFGAFGALAAFFVAREWLGRKTAFAAAALIASTPILIYFDGELLGASLEVFVNLLFLLALVAAWQSKRMLPWIAAGLAGGLCAAVRPNVLLPIVLLMLLGCFEAWRAGKPMRGLAQAGVVALGVAVFVLPIAARNRIAGKDWVGICSQAGINLCLGNASFADGIAPRTPIDFSRHGGYEDSVQLYGRRIAESEMGRSLKPSEISRYWTARTLREIAGSPGHWLKLMLKKTVCLFSSAELRNNKSPAFAMEVSPWLSAWRRVHNFSWLGPLALAGIVLCWRGSPAARILSAYVFGYALSIIAFFVCSRFRVPMIPAMILLAIGGLCAAWDALRSGKRRTVALWAAAVCFGAILTNVDWHDLKPQPRRFDLWTKRLLLERQGDREGAMAALLEALEEYRAYPDGLNALAGYRFIEGDIHGAIRLYQESLRADPDYPATHNSLAACYRLNGESDKAREAAEACLRIDPWHAQAYMNLGEIEFSEANYEAAGSAFAKAAELYPEHFGGHLGLAKTASMLGQAAKAAEHLETALLLDRETVVKRAMDDPNLISLLPQANKKAP